MFVKFQDLVENKSGKKIKVFQSDRGGEFIDRRLTNLFEFNGIFHQLSCPRTLEQNDIVERKHQDIVKTSLTMFF